MTKKPDAMEERNKAADGRLQSPSVVRNRSVIAEVLLDHLPDRARVLEIASGTGEHALHVLEHSDQIVWQPSDISPSALKSIEAWREMSGHTGFLAPIELDASNGLWPLEGENEFDAVVCINMLHISPWQAGLGVIRGAKDRLKPGGLLFFYGPFKRGGVHTSMSNEEFDASLRARDESWGVRDIDEVKRAAKASNLTLDEVIEMPANNLSLVFRRTLS